MSDRKKCLKLFLYSFYTSVVAFGGGYVIICMLRELLVNKNGWLTDDDMTDCAGLAQSAPGPVGATVAMLAGFNIAGPAGAFSAMAGSALPPVIIISAVCLFFNAVRDSAAAGYIIKGMRAGVGAVIISICYDMIKSVTLKGKNIAAAVILALAFALSYFFKTNAVYIVLAASAAGIAVSRAGSFKNIISKGKK